MGSGGLAVVFSAAIGALASVIVAVIANRKRDLTEETRDSRVGELEDQLDGLRTSWSQERREWQDERVKLMLRVDKAEREASEAKAASRSCQDRERALWNRISEQDAKIAAQRAEIEQLKLMGGGGAVT